MLIFLHNNVTMDLLAMRTARLLALKTYIMAWKDVLSIPDHLVNWALEAYDSWMAALAKSQKELAEESAAYDAMHYADALTFKYYAKCKALLLDTYGIDDVKLKAYRATGRFPDGREDRIKTVRAFIDGHYDMVAAGDPDVLPEAFINKLVNYWQDSTNAFANLLLKEKPEARKAVDAQEELFAIDSEKLRVLYSWVLMTWARSEPNLVQLGFAPQTGESSGGGEVPLAPVGFDLKWLEPMLKFIWMPVEGATSYQLAFSVDGGGSWEELYSGAEAGFDYEPPAGLRQYRVRARNANGFGDWSVMLDHEVEGEPPAGEWPSAPTMLGVELMSEPSEFMRVFYGIPGGSDSISLYRAVVPNGDPAPERPAVVYETGIGDPQYADTDIEAGNDYYYWACGVKDGIEGDFAGPAMCSI